MTELLALVGSATFWVLVSFVVFIAVVGRRLLRFTLGSLDRRSEQIVADLDDARRLRSEAEVLHRDQAARLEATVREADAILAEGRETAQLIRSEALAQLRTRLRQAAQPR